MIRRRVSHMLVVVGLALVPILAACATTPATKPQPDRQPASQDFGKRYESWSNYQRCRLENFIVGVLGTPVKGLSAFDGPECIQENSTQEAAPAK